MINNTKTKKIKYLINTLLIIVLFGLSSRAVLAANRYWVAPFDGVTSASANWSLTSGGSGGASVPGIYDVANFDSGSSRNATVNANMTVADFLINSDYSGFVSLGDGVTLVVGSTDILPSIITVGKSGTQISTTTTPVIDRELGGAFTLFSTGNNATTSVIKIKQVGSLATSSISNIRLYYKAQTMCSSTKPVDATLFGTTTTFVNSVASSTGSLPLIKDTNTCLYVVYDLTETYSTSTIGRSIDFEISNPAVDMIVTGGTVGTISRVNIDGRTIVVNTNTDNNPNQNLSSNITSVLSLKMNDPAKNPTVFYLQNNAVWKMEGGGTPIRLTNSNLKVHSLVFTDLAGTNGGAGTVKMTMTISNVNIGSDPNFMEVTRTYSTTATVKAWSGVN